MIEKFKLTYLTYYFISLKWEDTPGAKTGMSILLKIYKNVAVQLYIAKDILKIYALIIHFKSNDKKWNRKTIQQPKRDNLCIKILNFVFISICIIDETKRERDFYKSRNLPCPKDLPQTNDEDAFDRLNETHIEQDYHRKDEQVNVCLECMSNITALKRRFIRCSSQATITHLKKFVAKKVLSGMDKYKEVNSWQ